MCGGGGWIPSVPSLVQDVVQPVVQTVQDVPASLGSATREAASEVKGRATLENLSYVSPVSALLTSSGREQLAQTYRPLIAPLANAVAPGAGGIASSLVNGLAGNNPPPTAGDSGWGSLFSRFVPGSAPLSQGAGPQPAAWGAPASGSMWAILAAAGAAVLLLFVLLRRR